ncbi:hypothetical protein G6O69_19285 [Pseudenhygromyxa sp. WMMC2535]|uniref:hypothetical protein n=1 Tax=Pseudenhygromyxa sp. WMMC2535 TaxID=2712867 RepID=UPI001555EC72|nr:hypothetical protein [Pseudenhygromyxa sp. WMMC2535]NVB39997.1 hypothetical protein [Pseudenhygromyxa sp. WMMC2535]
MKRWSTISGAAVIATLCASAGALEGTAWAAPTVQRPQSEASSDPDAASVPAEREAAPDASASPQPGTSAQTEAETKAEPAQLPEASPDEPAATEAPPPDAGLPSYSELPSYADTPSASPIAKPEPGLAVPRDGLGLLSAGGIVLAGGVTLTGISSALIVAERDTGLWFGGLAIGSVATAAGIVSTIIGSSLRKKYRGWASLREDQVPPQGNGLRAAGVTCVIAGPIGMTLGVVSMAIQDEDDLPYGETMLGLGSAAVVASIPMLVIGARRQQNFRHWRIAQDTGTSAQLVPSFSLLPGGATLGVGGRF